MTALVDIINALGAMPPVEKGKRRFVVVGKSAMRALKVETNGERLTHIGNSNEQFPIVETEDFDGWEIADRSSVIK